MSPGGTRVLSHKHTHTENRDAAAQAPSLLTPLAGG